MDRAQLLNDQEEAMRLILDGRQACTWTAMPGIVQSVNSARMTCVVQPAILAPVTDQDGAVSYVKLPLLLDCPLVFPNGGGFMLTFPVAANDEVLVVFANRCIDAWWQSSGTQKPMEARMNDLSDGFALVGPKSLPNALPSISTTKTSLRNTAGTVYFQVGTKFAMKNATTDLKTVLADLQSLLNSFMGSLAALAPPSDPATKGDVSVPAATAVAALTTLNVKINALLENS